MEGEYFHVIQLSLMCVLLGAVHTLTVPVLPGIAVNSRLLVLNRHVTDNSVEHIIRLFFIISYVNKGRPLWNQFFLDDFVWFYHVHVVCG